jgi:hypothetical protein
LKPWKIHRRGADSIPRREAQSAFQKAIKGIQDFINGNAEYQTDCEHIVNVRRAIYDYFVANPNVGQEHGTRNRHPAIYTK